MKNIDLRNKIKNKVVALSTITFDYKPYTIAVEVNDLINNKILITDDQMKKNSRTY